MSQFEVRARLKVREGKLEGFKQQAAEMMRVTRDRDQGTLAYDWFLSADGTECEVHEAYVDADALVDHAFHVREARDAMFADFAYGHQMTFYGEPTPRLAELVKTIGVNATVFSLLQALEPAGVR
jgi:quinol monooxygenase YgiN